MLSIEKHRRQAECTVIVTMMLFVVISDVSCRSMQSNNPEQQDDPYSRALTQFLFATRFNIENSKHASTPPSSDEEKYLPQGIQCRAIYNNTKSTVKEQKLLIHPIQIKNNEGQQDDLDNLPLTQFLFKAPLNHPIQIQNNKGQQDDLDNLPLTQFLFKTPFNRKSREHDSMPPSIDEEKYLLQGIQCRAIYNNTKNTVKKQKLLTHPLQIQNNNMQNTTITSPTIEESDPDSLFEERMVITSPTIEESDPDNLFEERMVITSPTIEESDPDNFFEERMEITSPTIQHSENKEKFIQYLATKPQLQTSIIMENNQYPIAVGRTITFICNPFYCYEIDPSTGKKTYYICNESFCYPITG